MIYVATYIDIQPVSSAEAISLMQRFGAAGAGDGARWNGLMQEISRRNRFAMVEAWNDEASLEVHESAPHTLQFRENLKAIHNSPYDRRVHLGFAVGPEPAPAGPDAICIVTHVDVPPPRRAETEVLLQTLVEPSRTEAGNLRYDVFQQLAPRTNHFTVFAVWRDQNAFVSYEAEPHTREFREALGPMLGAPYDERLYLPI